MLEGQGENGDDDDDQNMGADVKTTDGELTSSAYDNISNMSRR